MTSREPAPWSAHEQPTLGHWLVIGRLVAVVVWSLGLGTLIAAKATGAEAWHNATFVAYLALLPFGLILSAALRERQRDLDREWGLRLHDLAMRDELTGLFNRRHFNSELDRLASDCELTGVPLSLAFIDLNEFKLINDVHGHEAGDAALQSVAHCLVELVGDRGIVARTGGDEFGVLLPGMSEGSAKGLFGAACRTMPVSLGGKTLRVEGTVGIAALDVAAGVPEMLRRADDDLYERKRARNRPTRAA